MNCVDVRIAFWGTFFHITGWQVFSVFMNAYKSVGNLFGQTGDVHKKRHSQKNETSDDKSSYSSTAWTTHIIGGGFSDWLKPASISFNKPLLYTAAGDEIRPEHKTCSFIIPIQQTMASSTSLLGLMSQCVQAIFFVNCRFIVADSRLTGEQHFFSIRRMSVYNSLRHDPLQPLMRYIRIGR